MSILPDRQWRSNPTPPPAFDAPPALEVIEAPDDPHRLARLFLAERCQHADGITLRHWRDVWRQWTGSAYRHLPDGELRAELNLFVKAEMDRENVAAQLAEPIGKKGPPTARKVTKHMLSNVEAALASMTVLSGSVAPPSWYTEGEWSKRNLISMSNGLLDVDALFSGASEIMAPHSPRWFSENCLPYRFDVDADCPTWLAFLKRNLEDDTERIDLLQEFFGYCLTIDSTQQKFLFLEGEGSNGKSVVLAVLEAMLGSGNCSHVPLEVFGERFQLSPAIGKLVNIAPEIGELDKVAEGYLKSFTSGDTMQFENKRIDPFSAIPTARLVLSANNRPRFSDRSGGLWRRMILMPFRVAMADDDPGRIFGLDKQSWWEASGELPGILNWALAGKDRLTRQGRFTKSRVCQDALSEYRTENNPARLFLSENYAEAASGQISCRDLYQTYRAWCIASGYAPLADRTFGKEVARVFVKVKRRRIGPSGHQVWTYCGLECTESTHL